VLGGVIFFASPRFGSTMKKTALAILVMLMGALSVLVTAYSFNLGSRAQNILMLMDAALVLVFIGLIVRGKWPAALIGASVMLALSMFLLPRL
jgi:hypothetical protein